MGFFDLFKSKKVTVPPALEAFDKQLFPGGQPEKDKGGHDLHSLLKGVITFEDCRRVFVKAKVRFSLQSEKDPDAVMDGIRRDSNGLLGESEVVKVFIYVALGKKVEDAEEAKALLEILKMGFGRSNEGVDADVIPMGFGEFGLEVTNPIPVRGIISNEVYLSRLRLPDGSAVTWKRIGSFEVKNIEKQIDGYRVYGKDGQELATLYLSPYNRRISGKSPKGFVLTP